MQTAGNVRTEDNRTYLEGVARLDWGTGEMCEFASALTRMLRCVGEEVPYHYLMGVTGVAFRFTIGPEVWNPGFYEFAGVAPDVQDLFRRAFAAVGYEYHWYSQGDREEDWQRITDSLDRGLPVMLRGHVVDASDWVLVTGYEHGGDLLFGSSTYSAYGAGQTVPGYDDMPEWHAKTKEYLLLGERAAPREVYAGALRLAVDLVRESSGGDVARGLRAYEVLAAALRDEQFPAGAERDDQTSPGWRYLCVLCHDMMLDDHRCAAPFLRDAAQTLPESAAELLQAADCYERGVELRDHLESIMNSDFSPETQKRLLDPEVRDQYAQILLQIRDSDEEGIAHVEQALAEVGR